MVGLGVPIGLGDSLRSRYVEDDESVGREQALVYQDRSRKAAFGATYEAHWRLGRADVEGVGNHSFIDYTGNAHRIVAESGDCAFFDAADDRIVVADHASLDGVFSGGGSLGVWVNPRSDGQASAGFVACRDTHWFLRVGTESGGEMRFYFRRDFSTTRGEWRTVSRELPINTWSHVVVVYDEDSTDNDPVFYVNGESVPVTETTTPAGTPTSESGDTLTIGNDLDFLNTWDGFLSRLFLVDSALSAAQVLSDFTDGLADSSFVALYKMDEADMPTDAAANSGSGAAGSGTCSGALSSAGAPDYSPSFASSPIGQAWTLNGTDEGAALPLTLMDVLNSDPFGTWMTLVRPVDATPTANMNILFFNDEDADTYIRLYVSTGGKLVAAAREAGVFQWVIETDAAVFSDNTWAHVAIKQDGVAASLFVDGVEVAQTFTVSTAKTKWFQSMTGLDGGRIGSGSPAGSANFFAGDIDDIKIYGSAHSDAHIAAQSKLAHTGTT